MTDRPGRIVWAYDREHLLHPFIVLGLSTLVQAGYDCVMVSGDKADAGAGYRSYDDFSFARRVRNYQRTVHDRRRALEEEAVHSVHRAKKLRKPFGWARQGLIKPLKWKEKVEFFSKALGHDVRHRWIQFVRLVLKGYGNTRRLTWDTWLVYLRGFRRLAGLKADVMIVSRPESGFWACIVAKARGMRLVYFPFELYGEQIVKPSWFMRLFERLMLRFLVDAVITQNDCRADVLTRERGSRVKPSIVHNYKPIHSERREGGKLRKAHGLKADSRVVLYEGMVVDGRWLEFVAQSVTHLPDDVTLIFMGQEKMKWRLVHAEQIKAPLATGRLIFAPPVPHDDLPDYVADADVGVIIYDDTVRNNVFCEPGKLSDYIAVGVPVVAPNFPTIGPVVRDYDIGRCFDGHSPEAIAATIMTVLDRPKREWSAALERACSELTWETQAPNLLRAVGGEKSSASAVTSSSGARADDFSGPAAATLDQ